MKKPRPFHPVLFALYPVLSLYAPNTALIPPTDVLPALALVLAATILLWAILSLISRNVERSASAASLAAVGFFSFGPILDLVRQRTAQTHTLYPAEDLLWWWVPAYLVCVGLAFWRGRGKVTGALNAASVVLAAWPAFTIVFAWIQGARLVIPDGAPAHATSYKGPRPDIYYVILDGYGRSDVLRRDVGLDNSEFIEGLKKRGFFVADQSHSNYCQTELSLTSSLNMGFLPDLVPVFDPSATNRAVLDRLIDRNQLSQELRNYGYRYVAITSGFPGVYPRSADLRISEARTGSLFEGALLSRTPFPDSGLISRSAYDRRRADLEYAVHMIGNLGASSQPRFVFAHILAPHPPFVFGPNGEPIRPRNRSFGYVDGSHFMQNGGTPAEYANGYAGQAKTLGRLVLRALDDLLRSSKTPPIVVIQGDHGPKLHLDQEELSKTDVNEVFPILNAYLVPDQVKSKLYPQITPVNTFRTILREQFGEPLPNLKDRSWYSSWSWPFRFEEVTSRLR